MACRRERQDPQRNSPPLAGTGVAHRFRRIHVEVTNLCNLRCPFCVETPQPKGTMAAAAFARVAAQLQPLTDEVVLHVLGEPLTHPDLAGILAAAGEVALPVHAVTNGVLLDDTRTGLLLLPVVRQVSISLHSAASVLAATDLETYLEGVVRFCTRAARERPDLYVNLRLWHGDGPRVQIGHPRLAARLSAHYGQDLTRAATDVRRRKNMPLRGRHYLHFDTRFEWPRMDLPEGTAEGTCYGLTSHFGILVDGTAVPCCLDAAGIMALGNVFRTPVSEILAGERARTIRDGFRAGRREEPLCRRCTYSERFGRLTRRDRVP